MANTKDIFDSPMTSFNQDITSGGGSSNGSPANTVTPFSQAPSFSSTSVSGVYDKNPPIPSDVPHTGGRDTPSLKFFEDCDGSPAPMVTPMGFDFPFKNAVKK